MSRCGQVSSIPADAIDVTEVNIQHYMSKGEVAASSDKHTWSVPEARFVHSCFCPLKSQIPERRSKHIVCARGQCSGQLFS
jgi:hypothetical protein